MSKRAVQWGIETDYLDAFGQRRSSDPDANRRMIEILSQNGERPRTRTRPCCSPPSAPSRRRQRPAPALGAGGSRYMEYAPSATGAMATSPTWPAVIDLAGDLGQRASLSIRSMRCSTIPPRPAHLPTAGCFSSARYIDVEAIPGISRAAGGRDGAGDCSPAAAGHDRLSRGWLPSRRWHFVLPMTPSTDKRNSTRQREFESFRQERGPALARFACFEHLRAAWLNHGGNGHQNRKKKKKNPTQETLEMLRRTHRRQHRFP